MEVNRNATDRQSYDFMNDFEYATFGMQVVLGLTGILGNALVCVTIARAKFMHNVTNFLIAHMALADILVCASLLVFQERYLKDVIHRGTTRQQIVCKFFCGKIIMWLFCNLSVLSMVCVTMERYVGIVHPLKYARLIGKKQVGIMIAVVWGLAVTAEIPHLAEESSNGDTEQCFTNTRSASSTTLVCIIGLMEFYLPVAILVWCYRKITVSLRKGAEFQRRENNRAPADKLMTARRRVIKVLLIVASLYIAIWLPINISFMFVLFNPKLSLAARDILTALQPTIACVNSVVNPFVYALKYKEFQRGVRHVFHFGRRRKRYAAAIRMETIR